MKKLFFFLLAMALGSVTCAQHSPNEQAARQARSVHLQHQVRVKKATVYYIEGTIHQSYPGTYVCLIGFHAGYCGVQELGNGERKAIFSIWEPSDPLDLSANPNVVQEASRTHNLYAGEGVHVSRFGGEGTGGKSVMPFAWKEGEKVRFAISCAGVDEVRTGYTCWIYMNDGWFRMASFSSLVGEGKVILKNPFSFVEDFLRNVESRDHVRHAQLSRLWAFEEGAWQPAWAATFTADSNALTTIDAGSAPAGQWLMTGGNVENKTSPLWSKILPIPAEDDSEPYRQALINAIKATTLSAAPEVNPAVSTRP